ncbi:hypothetical protein RHSIM_Rhsim02G0227600 [Rhododendron simsii]|uniref:Glycine-rich protein n=1 Tax=Rhododendron simsii TaxID=118357 RepID=A0A834HDE5_RHOSS|nr:hypothetical protein RHSIM_Rhsim02G0227600 [Rhododendron simsii]
MCWWWWLWPTDVVEGASIVAVGVGGVRWCGASEQRETGREEEGQNCGGSGAGDVANEFLINSHGSYGGFGGGVGEKRREEKRREKQER